MSDPSDLAIQTAGKLETHEAICAQRQGAILDRLVRIERIVIGATGSVIIAMAVLLMHLAHL